MSSIHLYQERLHADTLVPNQFIDQYMPQANGEFVKVYLYLLRCMTSNDVDCSISQIADTFNHTENDIIRALNYWERERLLELEYNGKQELTGIRLLDMNTVSGLATATNTKTTEAVTTAPVITDTVTTAPVTTDTVTTGYMASSEGTVPAKPALEKVTADSTIFEGHTEMTASVDTTPTSVNAKERMKREYSLDEIKKFQQNPDISELFFITETYLKHPLSSTDINTILYWYDTLEFSTDLIEYLVEYCISKGHSSIRYMDKVAIGWKESNITNVMQAKENAAIHSQVYYGVIKALGITGRNLVESEQQFLKKWTDEYHFDLEIIQEACGRTITAIHQPSFEYTDSILSSWFQKNVHTLSDIKALDEAFEKKKKETAASTPAQIQPQQTQAATKRNKFANFNQREYDYDQLEKVLLNTSVQ